MNQASLSISTDLQPIIKKIYATGEITRADQRRLTVLIFSEQNLTSKECQQIREIMTRFNNGWLKVID